MKTTEYNLNKKIIGKKYSLVVETNLATKGKRITLINRTNEKELRKEFLEHQSEAVAFELNRLTDLIREEK